MKMRKLIMAALLSAVMVLLLMPASAFADSELLPEKIVYRGDTVYQPGILDSGGDKREPEFTSFYEPGSEIDITWSNGKTVTYVYKEFTYRQDGETLTGREHFPKEEAPHVVSDGDGSGNTYPDNYLGTDCSFGYNVSDSGLITVWCEKSYWSEEQDDEVEKRVDWKAQGKTPVGLSFDGKMLYEKTEDGIYVDTYPAGGKIIVKYSDGSTRKAVCKKWGTNKTENGETYPEYGYFFEGEKPVVSKDEEGYNFAENELSLEFDQEKASAKKGIPVTYMGITSKLPVTKKVYPKPTAAKFVPAKGFVVKAVIGQQSFDINDIGKKGNKFVVSMSDGTKRTYTYKNKNDGFVWKDSDGSSDSIYGYVELNKPVTKGTKNAAGKINVWSESQEKDVLLAVKIKAKATIYDTFAGYESYLYSGKKITPKVAVWYWNGKKYKKMPAKWYTCKPKANTKIGVYTFTVNYKKAYQKKYGKSMTGVYDICPKAPAISGVKAGKGSITVSWKKVAAKDQKNIDGFIIEYSMDKKMESEVYTAQVAGKGKTSTVIKGLEKGKTYYARVSTYKKVKKTAGHTEVWSYPSKAKSAKVK